MNNDRRQLPGGPPSGTDATPGGASSGDDRRELADLALKYSEILQTLLTLVGEFKSLEGVDLSRQALALEAELGTTAEIIGDSRRYLRDLAKAALP